MIYSVISKTSRATLFAILVSLAFSSAAGIGNLLKKKNDGENGSSDVYAMQENVVKQYIVASTQLINAQQLMSEAFGMSDQVALLEAEKDALMSGSVSDKDSLERNKKVTSEVNKALASKIESGVLLDNEGKEKYTTGLIHYFSGLYETKRMLDEGKDFAESTKSAIQSASMMNKTKVIQKLSAGTFLLKEIPSHAKTLYSSSKSLVAYARDHNIDVPKDATSEIDFP